MKTINELISDEVLSDQIELRKIVRIAGKDINFGNDLKMDHYLKVLFL